MKFERILLPILLPLALAACDSSQPSYSASNVSSTPPPPAAQQPAPAQAPTPAPPPPAAPPPQATAERAMPPRPAQRLAIMRQPSPRGIRLPPAETVGVGGCDDYVARYRECLTSDQGGVVAPIQRKYQLAQALARQVRKWNIEVKNGRNEQVAQACVQASSDARGLLGKLGCTKI